MVPPTQPVVSIRHVESSSVSDRDLLALVRTALDDLGGMRAFVKPGDSVLIKPNQTLWRLATDGVTTDPRVVAALVTLAREAGAGRVTVGDASGGDLRTRSVLEATGTKRLALAAGADEVVAFEEMPHEVVRLRAGGRLHHVPVPRVVLESDVVLNVPKAKTHFEDAISCALKNWVGVMGQEARPAFMDDAVLFELVARLHQAVPATLHVVDALWAGEGNGPAANEGVWMGCILAGRDPVSVDAVTAMTMGISPHDLRFARAAEEIGLGTTDVEGIHVVGDAIEDVAVRVLRTRPGFEHLPVRVLTGEGVTWAGSLGHFKSIADVFDKFGVWKAIEATHGPPTFMIGAVDDPDFARHVEEGPYFVIDDAALEKYRTHPSVNFIPGHPATHNIFPHLFRRLHVENVGPKALDLARVMKSAESYFHFRTWKAAPRAEEKPRA